MSKIFPFTAGAAAEAAIAGLVLLAIPASAAPARPAGPAICGPVVALIEYWLPVLDRAVPAVPGNAVADPWLAAATEIFSVSRFAPAGLRADGEDTGGIIGTLGAGSSRAIWRPQLRTALAGVRAACPSLPASAVTGPLPR